LECWNYYLFELPCRAGTKSCYFAPAIARALSFQNVMISVNNFLFYLAHPHTLLLVIIVVVICSEHNTTDQNERLLGYLQLERERAAAVEKNSWIEHLNISMFSWS
jgi:hypothetical protein